MLLAEFGSLPHQALFAFHPAFLFALDSESAR